MISKRDISAAAIGFFSSTLLLSNLSFSLLTSRGWTRENLNAAWGLLFDTGFSVFWLDTPFVQAGVLAGAVGSYYYFSTLDNSLNSDSDNDYNSNREGENP